ncbi:MAG: hypothetical protein WEB52_09895 [Dehalococcoidia bacterium]
MAPTITYRRNLSAEDAATGSILIEKSRWHRFPPPMREFAVSVGGARFLTRIVAEDCDCVPPPHQHYHLEANHFRDRMDFERGSIVEVRIDDGAYTIANA